MKYYCENCGMEFSFFPIYECSNCLDFKYSRIPAYETVAQWEKRTGRKYPDTAPVYAKMKGYEHLASWLCEIKIIAKEDEFMCEPFVVATEAGVPPEGWRPEKP